ncbi:MAG: hypothetical protein VKP70_11440 [Cyanobacteriota bacterium]|nr:hypothetical protein [Cyanobacteriota bacterium]
MLQPFNDTPAASLFPKGFAKIPEPLPTLLALSPSQRLVFATTSTTPASGGAQPTVAAQVLAAEMEARQGAGEALSLMVSTIASMVQAANGTNSRWNAG